MTEISESEFARIVRGIHEDRESICRHNPIGTRKETLLWMLMSALILYLSLEEIETPCFNGNPTAETYCEAIIFIMQSRMNPKFDAEKYLEELSEE